ncbi:rho guanine nucleotide exchange factor 17 [Thrips palmi]|uniref:Rho guanine nucleotide exchange factor 17 n=1 Tax=Thrips palmi TaxID=161013 RepID=A0A6P9A8T0_THRPL|nr:rho guanine nucleotide exchange factor 17 [Thrips palmi]
MTGLSLDSPLFPLRHWWLGPSPALPVAPRPARRGRKLPRRFWGTTPDTRTHVVVELYETERSYVESLDFLVKEYMQPLKRSENAGMVDSELVEQIFYQVPAILCHHREFLEDLQQRLENWDFQQKVGDVLLNAFTKRSVIDTYTAFINNWKTAKEAIKSTCQAKPAFARYLEAMAREHKGRLALDSLLIKPVQRIPRYELLIGRLLKHTDPSHTDHSLLLDAQREIHELAVKINCTERESLEAEQQQQTLRDLEALVDGCELVSQGRVFLRHDMVTLASNTGQGGGTRKERVLFLFSDLVVIARTKRNIRKPSAAGSSTSVASGLEGNRYRCSMKAVLDDLEIVKAKDESLRRAMREMEQLSEDVAALTQITELASSLHLPQPQSQQQQQQQLQQQQQQQQQQLEELARDLLSAACRQLAERQNSDSQLSCLDLTVNTSNGVENITVIFTKPDKRASWEETFNEAKTRLALSADRRPSPKFKTSVPIRKTRAGLQFTCAAPTLAGPGCAGAAPAAAGVAGAASGMRDVWVCNSDGYVGQVCVLSLVPEPNVTSCNGVCNARILCVAAIPATPPAPGPSNSSPNLSQSQQVTNSKAGISISVEDTDKAGRNLHLDSSSSSDEFEDDNDSGAAGTAASSGAAPAPNPTPGTADDGLAQPTMWLGTEDGCIHVYSCNDNIRIKRNKVKIQHGAAVHCIMYFDNRVFVSLANGDITVYSRDQAGGWNTSDPYTVAVGSAACPVTRMVPIAGRLWCSCQHTIKVLNTNTLQVEQTVVAADSNRSVTSFVVSGLAVWLSVQNSAVLKLYHASTFEHLGEVNVAPAVTKMLASCDDIIRQHKAACLRVTSLLACKDLLWIGTSAGVILTMPLPHVAPGTSRLTSTPNVSGVPHGHTGHVRFLTVVEASATGTSSAALPQPHHNRHSWKHKGDQAGPGNTNKLLVISGGDGYEDFRTSSVSEVAGKEDSTNHLLMWQV